MPDAVDTVVCAPDDGRRYNPKHIEQFPEINKLCNVEFYIHGFVHRHSILIRSNKMQLM